MTTDSWLGAGTSLTLLTWCRNFTDSPSLVQELHWLSWLGEGTSLTLLAWCRNFTDSWLGAGASLTPDLVQKLHWLLARYRNFTDSWLGAGTSPTPGLVQELDWLLTWCRNFTDSPGLWLSYKIINTKNNLQKRKCTSSNKKNKETEVLTSDTEEQTLATTNLLV